MTGKHATILFLSFLLAFSVGMGVLSATKVVPYEPEPADPWTNPSITTVIERPVTDIELVVGLAEIVADQGRQIKRLQNENVQLQQLVESLARELQRLQVRPPRGVNPCGPQTFET